MDDPETPPAGAGPTAARWRRLQELFDGLVALPAEARAAWLAGLGDDEALKREAARLVEVDEDAAADLPPAIARAPARPSRGAP